MVRKKWYTDKMLQDKMIWTRRYGQNGTDRMVTICLIFLIQLKSIDVTDKSSSVRDKHTEETEGHQKNHLVGESGIDLLVDDFVRTILSATFYPYHFVRYQFVRSPCAVVLPSSSFLPAIATFPA